MPDTLFSMSCTNIIKSHLKLAQIKLTTPLQMLPFKVSTHRKKVVQMDWRSHYFLNKTSFNLFGFWRSLSLRGWQQFHRPLRMVLNCRFKILDFITCEQNSLLLKGFYLSLTSDKHCVLLGEVCVT